MTVGGDVKEWSEAPTEPSENKTLLPYRIVQCLISARPHTCLAARQGTARVPRFV